MTLTPRAEWRGQPQCQTCGVRHLALFSDLAAEDFAELQLSIADLSFEPGGVLYTVGAPGQAVFTVRSGLVKLVQYLPNGGQRIVRLLRQGDTAGLEAVLDHPYRHAAITMTTALVCRIPATAIHQLNARAPQLCHQLMRRWQHSVDQADDWLTFLSTGTARARVARLLLYLKGSSCEPICQLFGRDDMAAILGITSETASRVIADYKRLDLVVPLPGHRFRCDWQRLEDIAEN